MMIMAFLCAELALGPQKPPALFDACVSNLIRMKAYSVHIDVSGSLQGKTQKVQYDLAVSGPDALIRVREVGSKAVDRTDRTFLFRGNKLTAYDSVASERLQRTVKGSDPITDRLVAQLGPLDPAMNFTLDPNELRKFFGGFRGFQDWRTSHTGDTVTIQRFSRGSATMFRFTGAKPMLSEVSIKNSEKVLHWTFAFHPGADLTLNIPSDTRSVYTFTERKAPARYLTPQAKSIVTRMLKAYGMLQNARVDIKADDGQSTLLLSGKRLREDRVRFSWAFDGSILTILNHRTGQFYRGKAMRQLLSEYITKVGGLVDPLILPILAHKVPYLDLFPTESTVSLPGSVGTKADIVKVTTSSLTVSLFVRRDNHLLDSMESETVDRPGQVQTRSSKSFTFSHLGETIDIEKFRLDPGTARVLPLPKIKMH